jgi:rhamnulokinase
LREYAAVDLGAESGRVVLGRLADGRVQLEEVHRFANRPVQLPDGLRWNLLALFGEALTGLAKAAQRAELAGIGVDAWGVDYALLDGRNRVLGLPFHYRDPRSWSATSSTRSPASRRCRSTRSSS